MVNANKYKLEVSDLDNSRIEFMMGMIGDTFDRMSDDAKFAFAIKFGNEHGGECAIIKKHYDDLKPRCSCGDVAVINGLCVPCCEGLNDGSDT